MSAIAGKRQCTAGNNLELIESVAGQAKRQAGNSLEAVWKHGTSSRVLGFFASVEMMRGAEQHES